MLGAHLDEGICQLVVHAVPDASPFEPGLELPVLGVNKEFDLFAVDRAVADERGGYWIGCFIVSLEGPRASRSEQGQWFGFFNACHRRLY